MAWSQIHGRGPVVALVLVVAVIALQSPGAEDQAGDPVVKAEWKEGSGAARAALDAMEGKAPPELKVKDWTNGQEIKLADLKGKVVLLDFWATWCGPCIASIPHTNALLEKYGPKGLVIIGVCDTQGAEKMAEVVSQKGLPTSWPRMWRAQP